MSALPDSAELVETLGFFDTWEERYKFIIDLGKTLAPLKAEKKIEANLVRGCQSQVWLTAEPRTADGDAGEVRLYLAADSDAFIVKGLLAVVLAAYNEKTPEEILAFDIESYLAELQLMKHLSMTRGNGVRAVIDKITSHARALA